MFIFNSEKKLLNFLKCNKSIFDSNMHYIILFNLNLLLTNFINIITKIKEDNDLKFIPVVILTSSIKNKDIAKFYGKHLNSYIIKPEDINELVNVLKIFKDFWFDIAALP